MNLILTMVIILLASFIITKLSKKINIPSVVALIITGIIFGIDFISQNIITPNETFIFILGDIGLLILMFLAGLESSRKILNKEKKDVFFIAIFAALTPFLLGFLIFSLLGFSITVSLIIGVAMSITAEATNAMVLLELKKIRTKIGSMMMGAGIIDDILGFILFITVTTFFNVANFESNLLIIGSIIVFFIGLMIPLEYVERQSWTKLVKNIFMCCFIPFFFISMGLHFDLFSLLLNPIFLLIILAIAVSGKILGTLMAKPFTKLNLKQLYLIGWSMNSRGAIELAIILIAVKAGILPVEIYSALVVMTLITTLAFPFILIKMLKKHPDIMD